MAHQLPVAEVTEEQTARLRELASSAYSNWKAKATPEMIAKGLADLEKYKNDPAFAQTKVEEFAKLFQEADANGDGRVDHDEYMVLMGKVYD